MKRLTSVFLVLVMLLTLLPALALSGSAEAANYTTDIFSITVYDDSVTYTGDGDEIPLSEENLAKKIHFTASFGIQAFLDAYNAEGGGAAGYTLDGNTAQGAVEIFCGIGSHGAYSRYVLNSYTDDSDNSVHNAGSFETLGTDSGISIGKSGDTVTVSVDLSVAGVVRDAEEYFGEAENIEIRLIVQACGKAYYAPFGIGQPGVYDIQYGCIGLSGSLMEPHYIDFSDSGTGGEGGLTPCTPIAVRANIPAAEGFLVPEMEYTWYYILGCTTNDAGFPGDRSMASFYDDTYDYDGDGETDMLERAAPLDPFTYSARAYGALFGITCGSYVSEGNVFCIKDIMDTPERSALITALEGRKPNSPMYINGSEIYTNVSCTVFCVATATYEDGVVQKTFLPFYNQLDGNNCILKPCPHACSVCGLCTDPRPVEDRFDTLMGCQGVFDSNYQAAYCTCGGTCSTVITDVTVTTATENIGVSAVQVEGGATTSPYLDSVFTLSDFGEENVEAVYEITPDAPFWPEDYPEGVTLTLTIGQSNAAKLLSGELCLFHLDNGVLARVIPDSVDEASGTVTFTTYSFSPFLLAKELTDPDLRFISAGLKLNQDINVIYKAEVPAGYESVRAEFTISYETMEEWEEEPHTEQITVVAWNHTVDSQGRYIFEMTDLKPQHLGVEISAKLIAEKDGGVYTAVKEGYSVKQYCANMLAKYPDDAKLKNLLSDLLIYGEAAQVYTGSTLPPVTRDLTGLTPGTYPGLSGLSAVLSGEADERFAWTSAGLILNNDLGMYFTTGDIDYEILADLSVEVTICGRTRLLPLADMYVESLGQWCPCVSFDGVYAAEFDEPVTARFVYDGEYVGQTLTYTVNTYICSMQDVQDEALQALVRALYCYGASAEAYAGEKTNKSRLVGVITDGGGIFDGGFNQAAYDAAADRCAESGVPFACYAPSGDSTAARLAEVERAVSDGCSILVLPGFILADVIPEAAARHPDVKFLALDAGEGDLQAAAGDTEYEIPANVYAVTFKEEIAGYLAGYAAVKLGYRNLGFLGGMEFPAVQRYGYGFLQGADAAADELNATGDVSVRFAYGNQFWGDDDITAYMDDWYGTGTQVVFACGGNIYTSAAEAAAKIPGAKVIGVDVDQADAINAYGEGLALTSAMKGVGAAVGLTLDAFLAGNWDDIGGTAEALPLVALPDSTQWGAGFTQSDCETFLGQLLAGIVTVSDDTESSPAVSIYVDYQGNIKQGDVFE